MKILLENLKNYIDLPKDLNEVRWLLEDLGLEVKRIEPTENGTIITFEFLANRGDHHCYLGIAREIAGRTGTPITLPKLLDLSNQKDHADSMPIKVLVQSSDCLRYSLSMFEKINKAQKKDPSQLAIDLFKPIIASDMQLDCFVVDITNLVNLEFGQPLHAFDADQIVGNIKVRGSLLGEKALPLFVNDAIILPEGTLVIADDQKILAIAGVIGCQEAKVTEKTTKIFLESAMFDPVAIRKTSKILGITTSATTRFERGSDPQALLIAVGRAAQLLQEEGWSLTAQTQILSNNIENRIITISTTKVAKFLGADVEVLTSNIIQNHLSMYGFKCQTDLNSTQDLITVEVPSWRYWDVLCAADLYEEIAKSIGYNKLPTVLPNATKGSLFSDIEKFKQKTAGLLFGQGFFEVMTDGFYSSEHRKKFLTQDDHLLWNHVNILNSKDQVCLKNNGLFQAVELIKENLNFKITNIKAFEWTRIFWPDLNSANGLCNEKHILWMIASGKQQTPNWLDQSYNADPLYFKGILEELFNLFNLKFDLKYFNNKQTIDISHPITSLLHPSRCAEIYLNNKLVGVLGEIHPKILMLNDIKQVKPIYMELYYLDLIPQITKIINYKKVPELQPLVRDITIKIPNKLMVGELISCFYKFGPKYLASIKVTNLYKNKDFPENVFITFTLTYQPDNNNLLSRNLINETTQEILQKTIDQFKEYTIEQN